MRLWPLAASTALALTAGVQAHAQPWPTLDGGTSYDVADVDLDLLLNQVVVSSTKATLRGAQAPAIITIITADEIAARGCTSLAELLRTVPGFYDVYDLVTHNVGVRGINGGARASGSALKVMIDGQPVDFRPTTGNFFGEELIPLEVVERIEILLGPASALYGANAYLGVINIITRTGEALPGVRLSAAGVLVRANPGFGGSLTLGAGAGSADVLVAASGHHFNRSGLSLPASSPLLKGSTGADLGSRVSHADLSRPKSLFARAGVDIGAGRLTLLATVQNLDTAGEFQDFGPVSHGTRVVLWSEHFRLLYQVSPTPRLALEASVHYLEAFPSAAERLNIGRDDYDLIRSVGVTGFGATFEARYQFGERGSVTAGLDGTSEDHLLQSFSRHRVKPLTTPEGIVLEEAGTITAGEANGARKTFLNAGVFAQLLWGFTDAFTAVAGVRADVHNIYGVNPSFRAGIVYAPATAPLSIKLLYGSSFKAPSADQLYTQPMKLFDIQGNPALRAQTAHTFELSFARAFGGAAEVSANVFVLDAIGRIEYVQRGLYLEAQNLVDEWVVGGEAELRLRPTRSTSARVSVGVARSISQRVESALPLPTNPLYPWIQAHASVDQELPLAKLHVVGEVSYVGPRAASQSNALERGENYQLPGYVFGAVAVSLPPAHLISDRVTRASLRVSNVFTTHRLDPGFGGIDLPAQGITATLVFTQQL